MLSDVVYEVFGLFEPPEFFMCKLSNYIMYVRLWEKKILIGKLFIKLTGNAFGFFFRYIPLS